jgi:hypothetical protein
MSSESAIVLLNAPRRVVAFSEPLPTISLVRPKSAEPFSEHLDPESPTHRA